ncbi:glycine cleavage system aminomethyltransferase GcvT [Myceligenerans pegani]|uniref:Aminomethyltransferase n=1 Tax=Myceligenerans pegani TaxID=2776917 RepID=A0ABR9N2M8_9MICO|nr:glycine cleavage system aminomethyltransferase GcvT [Myceligenerans sp. TRM 65318]MBE1877888.1 glycine cleavage system aminomethyltransferase GcvT [Myceligenerans sp. TRM 65318]MBE3020159.1 glycine cleavage system aminomethyltransferase GcvT [Myceligenerans sp. TRM 65318]
MTDKRTPLHEEHAALGAHMTGFGGWQMPLRYTSDLAEHRAVREAAGLFDLSHMGDIGVHGPDAAAFLDHALVGAISQVQLLRARYSMICADDGGVLDDLIVYRTGESEYFVVANAANTDVVLGQLRQRAARFDVEVAPVESALLAVQGPRAEEILRATAGFEEDPEASGGVTLENLRYYACAPMRFRGEAVIVGRTGYTGEDGFEIWVSPGSAVGLWRALLAAGESFGLVPAGLSARDSLRLEAGMPLYGHELDTTTTPFEAGMGRVVRLDKETADGRPLPFVGREALASRKDAPPARVLVGLRGEGRRPARAGYDVVRRAADGAAGAKVGSVTSGAPSPTLGYPVAMAYVTPEVSAEGTELAVDVRGRTEPFVVVPLPFYRRTK